MLVHMNPRLLKRAIRTLSSEDCAFFIHIDRKVDIDEFSIIREDDHTFLSKQRIPVYWGEFSQVEATMQLVRQAFGCSANYDYFVFSTGSDYPLRSGRYIHRFLEKNRGWEFMSLVKMPAPGYPLSKINTLRYPSDKPVRRFATRALAKLGFRRDYRKYLGGLEAYAGHGSWALSRDACQYIVEFATCNPHLETYFRNTFTSDEMFFHTILGNSSFRPRVRKSLTYIDWPVPGNHPAMLNDEHVRIFEAQEKVWVEDEWGSGEMLFARKFSDDSLDLLDRIDEMIRRKEAQVASSSPTANLSSPSL